MRQAMGRLIENAKADQKGERQWAYSREGNLGVLGAGCGQVR